MVKGFRVAAVVGMGLMLFPQPGISIPEWPYSIQRLNSPCRSTGHFQAIQAVAIAPDGKTAITGGDDATIRVWDAGAGRQQQVLTGHTARIVILQFSRDGRYAISGSLDGTIRVWDAQTWKQQHLFEHPAAQNRLEAFFIDREARSAPIEAIALSPDNQTLVSSDGFGTLKVWDLANGREKAALGNLDLAALRQEAILALQFTPDGRSLLVGSLKTRHDDYRTIVSRWELETGQSTAFPSVPAERFKGTITWGAGYVLTAKERFLVTSTLAFSPDGNYAAIAAATGLVVQNLNTGEIRSIHPANRTAFSLSISPDSQLVAASNPNLLNIWNLATGELLYRFQPPQTLQLWDFGKFFNYRTVAIAPDNQTLIRGGGDDGSLHRGTIATEAELTPLSLAHREIQAVRTSEDSKIVAMLVHSNDVWVYWLNLTTGQSQNIAVRGQDSDYHASHITIALSPDGQTLVTGHADGSAKVWNAATGQQQQIFKSDVKLGFATVAFGAEGRTIVKRMSHGGLEFWDIATGKALRLHNLKEEGVEMLKMSENGKIAATVASRGNKITLWDSSTGESLKTISVATQPIAIAVSNDATLLITANREGTVTLWDMETKTALRSLSLRAPIRALALLSDNQTLIAGGDREVSLWNLETATETAVFPSDRYAPITVRKSGDFFFSIRDRPTDFHFVDRDVAARWQEFTDFGVTPDNKFLLTGSRDGTVQRWDLTTHQPVEAYCSE
jgi:WD40 repeat protein